MTQLCGNLCWGRRKAFRGLEGLKEFALRDGPRLWFKLASLSEPDEIKGHPQGGRALLWDQVQVPSGGSPDTSDSQLSGLLEPCCESMQSIQLFLPDFLLPSPLSAP